MKLRKDEHSVVAFYGFANKECLLEKAFDFCLACFKNAGYAPNLMAIGEERSKDFSRTKKKLAKAGFAGIDSFHVALIEVPVEPGKHEGPTISFRINLEKRCNLCYFNSCSSVIPLDSDGLFQIAQGLSELLHPCYGMGYRMLSGYAATFHTQGLFYGRPEEAAATLPKEESSWVVGMLHEVYKEGLIRTVYSWNFLTEPHLKARVGELTLKQWILADSRRGLLKPVNDEMVLWEVFDEALPEVRKVLWDEGVIFDQMRHPSRPKREGPPLSREEALAQGLKAFGYESAEEVQILQKQGGKVEEMPTEEIEKILRETKKGPESPKKR